MALTPRVSTYTPVLRPAFGVHDPDRARGYLFHEILIQKPGHSQAITIGRSKRCDIMMRPKQVSRRHAVVYRGDDQLWYIRPDSPTNGVFINGKPVFDSAPLLLGMRIRFGKFYLYTVNAEGRILVSGLDDDDYLANTGRHYGTIAEAARRIGKSHTLIGDRSFAANVRERLRREREAARRQKLTPSIRQSSRNSKRTSSH